MTTQAQNLCLFVSYGAYVIISDTINSETQCFSLFSPAECQKGYQTPPKKQRQCEQAEIMCMESVC